MKYLHGEQLSLIAEVEESHRPIGDWYEPGNLGSVTTLPKRQVDRTATLPKPEPKNLGSVVTLPLTDKDSLGSANRSAADRPATLPKSEPENLGSETTLPKSESENLGSVPRRPNHLLPKSIPMKIGLIQQKLNKKTGNYYWYWRYYDIKGNYRSIYAAANMYDAIARVEAWGIPEDASKKYLKNL